MNRRASAPPPKSSSRTGWTVVLVALASAAAAFILGRGFSNNNTKTSSSANSTAKTETTKKGATTTTVSSAAVPVTAPPPTTIAPASVKVLVLNGNGVAGSAGGRSKELVALGYQATAGNATKNDYAATAVYFVNATDQAAATAVGAKFPNAKVEPMPAPPPVDAAKYAGMNVVVLLGRDLASAPIAGAPAGAGSTTVAGTTAITPKPNGTATTVKA